MAKMTSTSIIAELQKLATQVPGAGAMARLLMDEARNAGLTYGLGDIEADLSRQTITPTQHALLLKLATTPEIAIAEKCRALQSGDVMNASEGRAVLHSQLRANKHPLAQASVDSMARSLARLGEADITDIVSVGIGGSDLGPAMAVKALAEYHSGPRLHFVSSMDPAHMHDTLAGLVPDTTAALIVSKTFTTLETLYNMRLIQTWFADANIRGEARLLAITANGAAAKKAGFADSNIILFDDAIGGRYSVWSAVGFGLMLAIGQAHFQQMLDGGAMVDAHVLDSKPTGNLPLNIAALRFWNTSMLGRLAEAILPYSYRLALLPVWVQQLEMESNGKGFDSDGAPLANDSTTAPIVFGTGGSQAQHAFFQHLHQSPTITPVTMLASLTPEGDASNNAANQQHATMLMQMLAQADALALGDGSGQFTGGRPSTIITWQRLTPATLGQLLAIYEYATIMAGWLWGVNSFDQPGVELGKSMATDYADFYSKADASTTPPANMTKPSRGLIARLKGVGG